MRVSAACLRAARKQVVAQADQGRQYGSLKVRHDLGFEKIPRPPLWQRGAEGGFPKGGRGGDFAWVSAKLNSIGFKSANSWNGS